MPFRAWGCNFPLKRAWSSNAWNAAHVLITCSRSYSLNLSNMVYIRSTLIQLFAFLHVFHCVSVEFQAHDEESYRWYYSYVEFSGRLKHLAEKYSHICKLTSVGREIWVIRITGHSNLLTSVPGKPHFRYVGNMHRDVVLSRQVLMYFNDYLLSQYGADPRVTNLIDSTDIYILPSVNPDGFEKAGEGDCVGSQEANILIWTRISSFTQSHQLCKQSINGLYRKVCF